MEEEEEGEEGGGGGGKRGARTTMGLLAVPVSALQGPGREPLAPARLSSLSSSFSSRSPFRVNPSNTAGGSWHLQD